MSDWADSAHRLWPSIERRLPPPPPRDRLGRGRPRISDREVFLALVVFLRAGCAWDVADRFWAGSGLSGRTVRRRLAGWRKAGTFEIACTEIMDALPAASVGYLDATFVRGRVSGSGVGLTRHGKGSRISVITDQRSWPIAVAIGSANPSERLTAESLLDGRRVKLPPTIVADRAYDAAALRDLARRHGSTLVAPHRRGRVRPARDQELVPTLYRERWRVERFFAWLAPWRRVATRWERSLSHYASWVALAISLVIVRCFCP